MPTRFVSTLTDSGCWIEFQDSGEPLAFEAWAQKLNSEERNLGASLLLLIDEGAVTSEHSLFVPAADVASFADRDLKDANLPPAVPYTFELGAQGTLASKDFAFEVRWFRNDRRRLSIAEVRGIELSAEGKRFVITDPTYTILRRVSEFNKIPITSIDDRLLLWADLCAVAGTVPDLHLKFKPDRYLQSLKVIPASRFTLDIDVDSKNELVIKPVLLAGISKSASSASVDSDELASPEPLLSPVQQSLFVENFFTLSGGRNKVPLGDGTYVVFDDALATALTHVRALKTADSLTKRNFLKNPHGYLRGNTTEPDAVVGEVMAEAVGASYFETEGFSERVSGIGLWQRPTLPWIQAQTQGWLPPESMVVSVSGEQYNVRSDDIPEIIAGITEAIEENRPGVPYDDMTIPATLESRASFESAATQLKQQADEFIDSLDTAVTPERRGPFALLGADNFEPGGFASSLTPRRHGPLTLPMLSTTLKPHQAEGVAWLQRRWAEGYRGALLADDMGLGKSLTTLAFLLWLRTQMTDGLRPPLPILVVVPTSLLHTWIAEHKSHLLGLGLGKPVIAYGKNLDFYKAGKRRKDVDGGQPSLQTELLRSESWIITTYETLRDYQISFGKIRIAAAVFDEAQRIKNPGASLKNASKNMNADFFIAATGTPVENRLADLWSIVDLIEPDYLGSLRDFSRKYEGKDAADSVPELRQKVEHSPTTATSGLMLRRMKDGTLRGLPTKTEHFEKHVMNDVQAAAYDDAIAEARQVGKKSRDVLLALHGIRTVSLHPDVTASVPDHEYIAMSARYSSAFEILDRIHSAGEKALIFLESLDAQMPLALLIQRRYGLRERPMIINGEVPPGQRQERVSAFQAQSASFDVMILSPRAGGVGLTLTTANHVIHLSRWWNPAVEDQCTDRVYRIGQEKSVHVHYLQAVHPAHKEHSFDVRLNSLLQRKRSLSRDLLAPMIFTSDDARQLFADTVSNGPVEDSH